MSILNAETSLAHDPAESEYFRTVTSHSADLLLDGSPDKTKETSLPTEFNFIFKSQTPPDGILSSTRSSNPSDTEELSLKDILGKDTCSESSLAEDSDYNLWFLDGNVLVKVQDQVMFKVYSSPLKQYSTYFLTILTDPPPVTGDCHVITLGDNVEDAYFFLKAIFHYDYTLKFGGNLLSRFDQVSGILKLSHKYKVETLRQWSIYQISQIVPSDPASIANPLCPEKLSLFNLRAEKIIALSREVNAPWLLPSALYFIALHGSPKMLNSFISQMDKHFAEQLLAARLALLEKIIGLVSVATDQLLCEDTDNSTCLYFRLEVIQDCQKQWLHYHPISPADIDRLSMRFCKRCSMTFTNLLADYYRKVVDHLPEVFNLPSWSELLEKKKVAILDKEINMTPY